MSRPRLWLVGFMLLGAACATTEQPAPVADDVHADAACTAWKDAAGDGLPPELLVGRIADIHATAEHSKVQRVRTAAADLNAAVDDARAGRIAPFSRAAIELHAACDERASDAG